MIESTKLEKAAIIAIKDYLGVSQDESILIVADENMREIGLALYEAGKKIAMEAFYMEMKSRNIDGQEPPDQIGSMMRKVDVVVCPTSVSLTHTDARRRACDLGVRVATMPGITEEIMTRCLSADPKKVTKLSEQIAALLKDVHKVKVETKLGTDIIMPIKGRKVYISTGVLKKIGESGNLPSGEVYVSPVEGKSSGIIVFDGSMSGVGLLNTPITVEVKNGYAKKITGESEAIEFAAMLDDAGREAHSVAEFGIGTNHKAKIIGKIIEDEKSLGTIHIAFGNNISMGGKVNVKTHLDGVIKKPTVYFDNIKIMDNGKFVDESL